MLPLILQPIQLLFYLLHTLLNFLLFIVTGGRRNILRAPTTATVKQSADKGAQMEDQQQRVAELYSRYVLVAEQRLSVNLPTQPNTNSYYSNPNYATHTREWIDGKKWEFTASKSPNSHQCNLKLTLLETELEGSPVTAEVVFWQWHRGKQIYILQKCVKVFQLAGAHITIQCNTSNHAMPSDGFFNVLIRLFDKREEQQFEENPCPPCGVDDEFVLRIGPEQTTVSKHYLMAISPVFQRMFTVDMVEKAQGEVCIEETTFEEFGAFLEAVSPKFVAPNPSNVLGILKLADRFQVEFLRNRCEAHLINCVEMSLIERLHCAEVYRLEKLKNFILKSLSGVGMREFYEENQAALNLLSKDLLIQLTVRICASSKIDKSALCNNCAKNVIND